MVKWMKLGLVVGVGLMAVGSLASCSVFDDGFISTVDDMVASGQLTSERGGEIIAAYMEWARVAAENGLWNTMLVGAGSVVAAYTGINLFPGKKIKNPS
jgi:hypothetical protein